jgi:hypothetical protein
MIEATTYECRRLGTPESTAAFDVKVDRESGTVLRGATTLISELGTAMVFVWSF